MERIKQMVQQEPREERKKKLLVTGGNESKLASNQTMWAVVSNFKEEGENFFLDNGHDR
jgi:hypothetical protein